MAEIINILLVEDNRMDTELAIDAFEESHVSCKVHVADNGQKALDYVYNQGAFTNKEMFPTPDLILLDLKMPDMDGHEVLRCIKSENFFKRIPIIILTSSKENADLIQCYDNFANSYLVKPVSYEGFVEMVQSINDYWLKLNTPPPKFS
ncbi:MAG: Signal transduction response regulator [Candidatus Magnetoglobus multicellularis str. Araruama]|uniref:Signal transduction response regulator n=1 Tax=Candidatus Magnetoglobus multicellularis str. Araruama TaxID=890399 RepID=A0A1V1PBL1_9BACT|nr:MAG: Signal transduction response regulator [Candidatus Magnetoglobus multicellularis str. Araruama]